MTKSNTIDKEKLSKSAGIIKNRILSNKIEILIGTVKIEDFEESKNQINSESHPDLLLDFDLNRSYKDPNFNEENYNDPIDAFNARDRATKLHEEVVKKLALICSKKNLIIRDSVHIDFYTEYKSRGKLFEIKTFNKSNFKKQIRHAIIQVKEYYFKYAKFNEEILKETDLFILLNENPEEIIEREQIEFLQDQNITLCWLQNDKIETFNENKLAIKWLL